jgi:hypothetical protein
MLAVATRAEGKFSLSLDGANVPLGAPVASDVDGTLAIQSAQVGPGAGAEPVLNAIKQVRSFLDGGASAAAGDDPNRGWMVLPKQDVVFRVHDGVVTNEGLRIGIGDVVITTSGRVAIESQQINLLVSIPMQDSWFKRQDGFFASLKGQTITIPVDGTLTQPRLDSRVIQDLGKQLAGNALRGVIGQQLERGLQGIGGAQPGNTQPGATQPGTPAGGQPRGLEGILQGGLGQGLNRIFGQPPAQPQPQQPQPQQPATPTRPR